MTDLRALALDGPVLPGDDDAVPDATPDSIEAQRGPVAPTGDPGETYYLREWRGGPLYGCPACVFVARDANGVARHLATVHNPARDPSPEERAARAGIVIAKR